MPSSPSSPESIHSGIRYTKCERTPSTRRSISIVAPYFRCSQAVTAEAGGPSVETTKSE